MKLRRVLLGIVYWLAVLAISLVLLVLLVRFFESRDEAGVERDGSQVPLTLASARF